MKDWGESVSELMIKKNNSKKLYTVLSFLGVFNFCSCCILIVSCVLLLVLSCVVTVVGSVYCCSVCIVLVCIVIVVLCVYCHLMCICCTMCALLFLL